MTNRYVTPEEIKQRAPGIIQAGNKEFDEALLTLAVSVSRTIDRFTNRVFYPQSEQRTYNGEDAHQFWIEDAISISALQFSTDNGQTYEALAEAGNWNPTRGGSFNHLGSYNLLLLDPNGSRSTWPIGYRALQLTAVYAMHDARDEAWEDSLDTVQDGGGINATVTTITVADVDGAGARGIKPRFTPGLILRIEDEFLELTNTNVNNDELTVVRGVNGTSGATHANGTQIDIWRPAEPIRTAAAIMATRLLERGLSGFGDASADADLGEMRFMKQIDPEAKMLLMPYRKIAVG